jgi:hypothetical protein
VLHCKSIQCPSTINISTLFGEVNLILLSFHSFTSMFCVFTDSHRISMKSFAGQHERWPNFRTFQIWHNEPHQLEASSWLKRSASKTSKRLHHLVTRPCKSMLCQWGKKHWSNLKEYLHPKFWRESKKVIGYACWGFITIDSKNGRWHNLFVQSAWGRLHVTVVSGLNKSKISPFMNLQDDQTAHSPVWRSKNCKHPCC